MNALEMWLVSYLANALWIVPLIFAAAWAAARLAQRLGPGPAHRIWVFALVTEALLPAIQLHLFNIEILRLFGLSGISSPVHSRTAITFSAFAGGHERKLILSHDALAAIATVYIAGLTYFATRLAYSLWKTHRIAMRADERCEERVADRWRTVAAFLSVDAGIAESAEIPGPVTVGVRRKLLLLPRGFASHTAEDLDAVMAHECAHMARHDFLKNLLYSLVSLPCAFHPFLWLTRARLSESREMVCDAIAAEMLDGPQTYARSLLRLASAMLERPQVDIHAIGIFDANHFERRIMRLTAGTASSGSVLRTLTFVACAAIGFGTCASALTLRTEIGTEANGLTGRAMAKEEAHPSMPVLISSKMPEYPAEGKEAHLSGICLVGLTVDQQGMPQDVHILRSLRPDFDRNAVAAVQEYRFKPALSEGKPVSRQIKVEVKFAYF
ncbi:M56 family metallopeptidase [Edaphobacter sp. 12200R-103]|uniref:M56 family metallopeptidase n=1 Tax=Edaphobacter sp. 12200R-103 TaxID=2703788 RepID=UPI00138CD0F5|nr:M56 family metallopeptidase [Edaphobacter sp. 12200R-103]QHS52702.1 M56 family metallopeptidase [Edaphobacter sp. 12200R-103]